MSLSVGQNLAAKPVAFGAQTEKKNQLPKQATTVAAGAGVGAGVGAAFGPKVLGKAKLAEVKSNKSLMKKAGFGVSQVRKEISSQLKQIVPKTRKAGAIKGGLIGAGVAALALVATKMLGGKKAPEAAQPAAPAQPAEKPAE